MTATGTPSDFEALTRRVEALGATVDIIEGRMARDGTLLLEVRAQLREMQQRLHAVLALSDLKTLSVDTENARPPSTIYRRLRTIVESPNKRHTKPVNFLPATLQTLETIYREHLLDVGRQKRIGIVLLGFLCEGKQVTLQNIAEQTGYGEQTLYAATAEIMRDLAFSRRTIQKVGHYHGIPMGERAYRLAEESPQTYVFDDPQTEADVTGLIRRLLESYGYDTTEGADLSVSTPVKKALGYILSRARKGDDKILYDDVAAFVECPTETIVTLDTFLSIRLELVVMLRTNNVERCFTVESTNQ